MQHPAHLLVPRSRYGGRIYESPPAADSLLAIHRSLAGPWVLGATIQCIFTGVLLFQAQLMLRHRARLSWPKQLLVAAILLLNFASSALEVSILWWFAMSITGKVKGSVCELLASYRALYRVAWTFV